MTFTEVTLKNFKFNLRKYMAYFLCSSFCIAILLMFSTLLFNDQIIGSIGKSIEETIQFSLGAVIIFVLFFFSYSHTSFMKSRKKEFGLFMTLGMTRKDINRVIFIENFSIVFGALILGAVSGTIFSRIFFMGAVKMLQIEGLKFSISLKCYLLALVVFLISIILITINSTITTKKLEISELLKSDRKGEVNKVNNPLIGILGMIIIVASFVFINLIAFDVIFKGKGIMIGVFVITSFIGLYVVISQYGTISAFFKRKNKDKYLHDIVSLSEIEYRFNQYRKIFFVLALLSAAAIFFIGIALGRKETSTQETHDIIPYDVSYIETANMNKLSQKELQKIILNGDTPLTEKLTLNYFELNELRKNNEGGYGVWGDVPFISEKDAEKILDIDMNIEKGHIIRLFAIREKYKLYNKGDEVKFRNITNEEEYSFIFQEVIYDSILNGETFVWIVNEEDYNAILKVIHDNDLYKVHLMNFQDWKKTLSLYTELSEKLNVINTISDDDNKSLDSKYKWKCRPRSKYSSYLRSSKDNNFSLFCFCFIGLIFLMSTGVVLYFKVYTEIEEGKARYKKLFRIGITDKHMTKIISKELRRIFFIPTAIGAVFGFGYIATLLVNYSYYKELLGYSLLTIFIYMMLQYIFYRITRKKYIKEVISTLN